MIKGALEYEGSSSNVLMNVQLSIYPNGYCQTDLFDVSSLTDGNSQICAGETEGALLLLNKI